MEVEGEGTYSLVEDQNRTISKKPSVTTPTRSVHLSIVVQWAWKPRDVRHPRRILVGEECCGGRRRPDRVREWFGIWSIPLQIVNATSDYRVGSHATSLWEAMFCFRRRELPAFSSRGTLFFLGLGSATLASWSLRLSRRRGIQRRPREQ